MASRFEQFLISGNWAAVKYLATLLPDHELMKIASLSQTCYDNLHPTPSYFRGLLRSTYRCDGSGAHLWNRPHREPSNGLPTTDVDDVFYATRDIPCQDVGSGLTQAQLCVGCGVPVCNVGCLTSAYHCEIATSSADKVPGMSHAFQPSEVL